MKSKLATLERAYVRMNEEYSAIVLPPEAFAPLRVEGSPWHRLPLSDGRVVLTIHRDDLARLVLDYADRVVRGEKVGDSETILLRRLTHPGEIEEALRVARANQEAHL